MHAQTKDLKKIRNNSHSHQKKPHHKFQKAYFAICLDLLLCQIYSEFMICSSFQVIPCLAELIIKSALYRFFLYPTISTEHKKHHLNVDNVLWPQWNISQPPTTNEPHVNAARFGNLICGRWMWRGRFFLFLLIFQPTRPPPTVFGEFSALGTMNFP